MIQDSKLLVLVALPLLDRDNTFEVFKIVNLPFPFPKVGEKE